MKLVDLFVQRFRVERVGDKMVITADTEGNYLAPNAEALGRVFNTNCPIRKADSLFVRIPRYGKWQPMIRRQTLNWGYPDLVRRIRTQ